MLKKLQISSREELILLCANLANTFNASALNNNKPNIVLVTGHYNAGKSLIVEGIMKGLLFGHNPLDLIQDGEKNKMFLESIPTDALHRPLYIDGKHEDETIRMIFDRSVSLHEPSATADINAICSNLPDNESPTHTLFFTVGDLRFIKILGLKVEPVISITMDSSLFAHLGIGIALSQKKLYDSLKWLKNITIDDHGAGVFDPSKFDTLA